MLPLTFDEPDPDDAAGIAVSVDRGFASAHRVQLDATSWVDHVPGWLTGDQVLMDLLAGLATWDQRTRWMYDKRVDEPRLTAEYPVIADAPHPVLGHLADALSAHYATPYERLWMNWYRDNNDGTGWHADRPADKLPEATIPVLRVGAPRGCVTRRVGGGASTPFTVAGGDLIVMGGRCQRDWQHMVPKQKTAAAGRMSLNFSAAW